MFKRKVNIQLSSWSQKIPSSIRQHVDPPFLSLSTPFNSWSYRISTLAGYLPSDVQGKSAFNFMLGDDLPWATMALRNSECIPVIPCRKVLRIRNKSFGSRIRPEFVSDPDSNLDLNLNPDPLVRGTDPDLDPQSSSKNSQKTLDSYCFVTSLWFFISEICISVWNYCRYLILAWK